jgi:hypothetical protein
MKLIFLILCCISLLNESSNALFNKRNDDETLGSKNQTLPGLVFNNTEKFNDASDDEIFASLGKLFSKLSLNDTKKISNRNKTISNKGTKKTDKLEVNKNRKTIFIVTKKPSDGSFRTQDQEKARLQNKYDIIISGNDFEHEHIIGVKVLIGNSDEKIFRDKGEGKEFTQAAPAYYEIKELHRKHAGTGTGPIADKFREKINQLMLKGDVAGAIIENIKEYGAMKEFKIFYKKDHLTHEFINEKAKIADDSFSHMIKHNPQFFMYIDGKTVKKFSLKEDDKFKIILSRNEVIKGGNLTAGELKKLKQSWGKILNDPH